MSHSLTSVVRRALLAEAFGDYSWVPRLDPQKRYIISSELISSVKRVPIDQQMTRMKPEGLWYGVGEEWVEYLRTNQILQGDHRYLYEVVVDPAHVLQVRTVAETIKFVREFGKRERDRWTSGEGTALVDWKRVAQRHLGVELSPHWGELRSSSITFREGLDWYASWDVGSGCVWDPRGFKSLQLIATSEDAKEIRSPAAPAASGQSGPQAHQGDVGRGDETSDAGHFGERFGEEGHFGTRAAGALLTTGRRVMLTLRSERVTEPGTWGIPGGAMEEDEYPEDTAVRETREETGIDIARLRYEPLGHYEWRNPRSSFTYTAMVMRVPESAENIHTSLNWESDDVQWVDEAWIRAHRDLLHPALQQYIDHLLPVAFDRAIASQPQRPTVRQELVRKAKILGRGDWDLEGEDASLSGETAKSLDDFASREEYDEYLRRNARAYRNLSRDIKKLWAEEVRLSGGSFDGVTFIHWGHCDDIESMIKNPHPTIEISACPYPTWPVVPLELERFESKYGSVDRGRSGDCRLGIEVRGRITFCANADLNSDTSRSFGADSRRKYFGMEGGSFDLQTWSDTIVTDKSQLRPNSDFTWRSIEDYDEFTRLAQTGFFGNWPEALIVNWRPVALISVPGPGSLDPDEVYKIAQGLPVKNTRGVVLKPW